MSQIRVHSSLKYQIHQPTSFYFSVVAARTKRQEVLSENLSITPDVQHSFAPFGPEGHRLLRVKAEPGEFSLQYDASVQMTPQLDRAPTLEEVPYGELPSEVLYFLNPSRYCESDELTRFALKRFGEQEPGFNRVRAICDWVHENLEYTSGSTNASSSAADVLLMREGVCRDYAHVGITMCRALGIPARYLSGYAVKLNPPDFHGFFEAFLDGRWYLFDPTRMAPIDGLVRIGVGRDAADVAFASFTGVADLIDKQVRVERISGQEVLEGDRATTAVSTV